MDKQKLLMEKYELPSELAKSVVSAVMLHMGTNLHDPSFPKKDNRNDIDTVKRAGKMFAAKTAQIDDSHKVISMASPGIKKVKFWLSDGQQITIDDPNFCGLLGIIINETEFYPKEKRSRGNQPNPPYLNEVAKELMLFFSGTDYSKRVKIGQIFAEFLQRFKDCKDSPVHLQKEVEIILSQQPNK